MSQLGHLRRFGCARGMSALPPIATESLRRGNRRKGPRADIPITTCASGIGAVTACASERKLAVRPGRTAGRRRKVGVALKMVPAEQLRYGFDFAAR